jgi:hypothetical protein
MLVRRRNSAIVALQEAAYICQGSAGSVMGMASEAQDDLWKSVTEVRCQSP